MHSNGQYTKCFVLNTNLHAVLHCLKVIADYRSTFRRRRVPVLSTLVRSGPLSLVLGNFTSRN